MTWEFTTYLYMVIRQKNLESLGNKDHLPEPVWAWLIGGSLNMKSHVVSRSHEFKLTQCLYYKNNIF